VNSRRFQGNARILFIAHLTIRIIELFLVGIRRMSVRAGFLASARMFAPTLSESGMMSRPNSPRRVRSL